MSLDFLKESFLLYINTVTIFLSLSTTTITLSRFSLFPPPPPLHWKPCDPQNSSTFPSLHRTPVAVIFTHSKVGLFLFQPTGVESIQIILRQRENVLKTR